jgi:hypothetical protein
MNMYPSQKKTDPKAEAKLRAITEELEIKNQIFEDEARVRVRRLENEIEETRHNINVAQYDIKEEVARGIKKIAEAAAAIVMPKAEPE